MASVDEHIETFPLDSQDAVRHIYDIGRRLAPAAQEGVSYGVPCLTSGGKGFCAVQRAAKHLTFIPFSAEAIALAADVLADLPTTKGSVHFTAATPLPDAVVAAVLQARLAEIG